MKILWFITKIDTDYEGAMAIIEIIDKFPGPLPENIALAIFQREDLEEIISKRGLNPDLLKKIYKNIDLETLFYTIRIQDRQGEWSNEITTPMITVNRGV